MTAREYLSMCSKVIDFYNTHKPRINKVEGLELHFLDLHALWMDLTSGYEITLGPLLSLYREKETEKKELEALFIKLRNERLSDSQGSKGKKGRKTPEKEIVHLPGSLSTSEIMEQYHAIMNMSNSFNKKDIQELETKFTKFILAMPVHNLLDEKIKVISKSGNKIISDMKDLMSHEIDKQMLFFKTSDPSLYALYQEARKHEASIKPKKSKGEKDSALTA